MADIEELDDQEEIKQSWAVPNEPVVRSNGWDMLKFWLGFIALLYVMSLFV